MDYPTARNLMQRYLDTLNAARVTYWDGEVSPEVVLFEDSTQERPYGWVFSYNSRDYQESGEFSDMVIGNGPTIVRRDTGELKERLRSGWRVVRRKGLAAVAMGTFWALGDSPT